MTFKWNEKEFLARINPAMMRGVVSGVELIRSATITSINSGSKTGRIYRRRGVAHRASAPGQAPASDTGRLVNSITTSYDPARFSGTIQYGTEYAMFLEFGTAKMAPRPFARPALLNNARAVVEGIAREITAALK